MIYLLERIQKICNEIKNYVYTDKVSINEFMMLEGNYHGIAEVENVEQSWVEFGTGDLWGGRDCHAWLKTKVTVPDRFVGKTTALYFKTFEEGWDAINPQFILYVNGEHVQGLDMNHREAIMSNSATPGTVYNIDLHTYSGMMADKKFSVTGELVAIDTETRALFYNLQVPVWVCEKLDKEDKRRIDMLTVLNHAVNMLDLRKPMSSEYNESVKKANDYLELEFYGRLCGTDYGNMTATCVGHTHIDVAWHWTVAQTREKVGRSFSTVLKLMEQYPEYVFMSSQPQLYKFMKQDYPDVYEKIKEKVKEGKWEAEGAMWLEADCNVTSGESLVRQILFGKRFFKQEFDVDNEVLWLPDVFGYSAALPQIMKKCGINYFMTTKIAWNQFNKLPYDTFMWKGIDGSEILTHFITTKDPYQDKNSHFTTYNGQIHPGAIMGAWDRYQQKNINDNVLVSFGFGDGGGGATYEMLETARRLEKGIPGCPKVEMGTSKDYFKKLEQKVVTENIATKGKNSLSRRLPKWSGELYLEYHRGTYTSMARNKRANRLCENLYQSAEKLSSFAMLMGHEYPAQQLEAGWENILLNQFHDILPGSSIKEVYEVTKGEYERIEKTGREAFVAAASAIASKINVEADSLIVFNTLSYSRSDVCIFDLPGFVEESVGSAVEWCLQDEAGEISKIQYIEDGKGIFFAKDVPSIGYKVFRFTAIPSLEIAAGNSNANTNANDSLVTMDENHAENKFIKLTFDTKGQISSLLCKGSGREVVQKNKNMNVLQAFEDKPMNFDNWDVDIFFEEKMWTVDDVQSIKVIENGPVRSTLEIKRNFCDSIIIQKVHVYNDLARVDFDTFVDWKQSQVLLKVEFPVEINANKATYEIQYGNVERETHNNTSWDLARFEVCGHKWADLSEDGFGVSLLNDCKYGYDIKEGCMRLTLIKSGIEPNPTTDQEQHRFTYSIYPHQYGWREAETVNQAYNLNVPMEAIAHKAHDGYLPQSISMLEADKDNIHIEVVKKAEDSDDIIVRLYEYCNRREKVTLKFAQELDYAYECSMLEENLEKLDVCNNQFEFEIKPYEIKTFKLSLKMEEN